MNWIGILGSTVFGNLLVLLAAIIGIGGSYLLYYIRTKNRRISARRALKAEIESMKFLTQWVDDPSRSIPTSGIGTTVAYESLVDSLGLLSRSELEKLTLLYSSLIETEQMLDHNKNVITQSSLTPHTRDANRHGREDVIASRIDQLSVWRWQSLQLLKRNLGEEYEPPGYLEIPQTTGEKIHKKHPVIRLNESLILAEGYFEPVDDSNKLYQLTEYGEEHFEEVFEDERGF